MKFSIVIPVLNEEHYIGVLLECLVHQIHKDFEVFIVDGDSKDKTKDVVLSYKDRLNINFLEPKKRGVAFQRNFGAKHATSDYIIFFDADVFIEEDFLDRMGTYITKHPTVDFITSRSGPISKKIIDKLLLWSFNEFYLNNVKFIKPGSCGAFICVKKKSFDKVNGFDESIVFAEDFELASRMFKLGYKYSFLRRPKFWFSVRRMDKMGRVPYALELLKNSLYMHLKGNIKDKNIINYDMETEH